MPKKKPSRSGVKTGKKKKTASSTFGKRSNKRGPSQTTKQGFNKAKTLKRHYRKKNR